MDDALYMGGNAPKGHPINIRPLRDWALVRAERRQSTTPLGLIIPMETTAEKLAQGTGHIMRIRDTPKSKAMDLGASDRIVFRDYVKYAIQVKHDLTYPDGERQLWFLIKLDDIVAVIQEGIDIWVYAGRPEVPSKEKKP